MHLHPIPIPARERDARKDHQNFFFDHEDYLREMGAQQGFNYTALRPQLVTGHPGRVERSPCYRRLCRNPAREGEGAVGMTARSKQILQFDSHEPSPTDIEANRSFRQRKGFARSLGGF